MKRLMEISCKAFSFGHARVGSKTALCACVHACSDAITRVRFRPSLFNQYWYHLSSQFVSSAWRFTYPTYNSTFNFPRTPFKP